jgi:hypothetical protein
VARARHLLAAFALLLCALLLTRDADAVGDPGLVWETHTTEHFQVHAHSGLRPIAKRVAEVAENVHRILSPELGWQPKERTQIVLTDDTDFANGSATSLPYNTVRLYVTAPDDLSALNDYDDWLVELVTHEYTHILHTDHITGIPAIYNAILGKTYSPNQMQPRWILEGLAVLQESRFTSGGRNRSSIFDMYLRADVLEDNVAPIDQISHSPRRWPQGNLWYLYGSHFLQYIAEVYGNEALRAVAADYGDEVIPYGINRAIHRATGRTYVDLYASWIEWMKKRYGAQKAAVVSRGLREGLRLTATGQNAAHPHYMPEGAGGDGAANGVSRRIAWYRDDGHTTGGIYGVSLTDSNGSGKANKKIDAPRLITRTSGPSSPAFLPDGALLYDSTDVSKKFYFFWDLFRRTRDDWGAETVAGDRLSIGLRASEPTVSPDGMRVAYVVNKAGTSYLYLSELDLHDGQKLGPPRKLLDSKRYEQVYTPRWSPDGTRLAYSTWTEGGYRDVRILDVGSGDVTEITHDRALDTGPVFSPDGKRLFYSSDRSGISNVYVHDLATGKLRQVTNVIGGAFQADPSPDGKHLAYIGYGSTGYDLYELDLDDDRFLEPEPYVDERPPRPPEPPRLPLTPTPYNPWPTLRPYAWSFELRPDAFGQAIVVTTIGGDVVGHHAYSLAIGASFVKGEPAIDFSYYYRNLPFDTRMHLYRYIAPRGGYRFGDQTPTWIEQTAGVDVGVAIPFSTAHYSQNVALSYSWARYKPLDGFPQNVIDPYTRVAVYPQTGYIGSLHFGWSWANVQRFVWSVSNEIGFALFFGVDVARPELAGQYTVYAANYNAFGYFPVPILKHHVLALHANGGVTGGDYGRRGGFALGGFADTPLPDALRNLLIQPGVALRGYKPGARFGDAFQLFNAEYRFPILDLDRGVQTLPLFVNRIYGNLFADYGDASFEHLDLLAMKFGFGAEVLLDLVVGYFQGLTLRTGFAKGTSEGGETQTYFVLSNLF